jgi:hypothetical protein
MQRVKCAGDKGLVALVSALSARTGDILSSRARLPVNVASLLWRSWYHGRREVTPGSYLNSISSRTILELEAILDYGLLDLMRW